MRLWQTSSMDVTPLKPLAVVLALLLVAMLWASATKPEHAGADYTINAVYFPGASPVIDPAQTSQVGIRIVSSAAALQAEAETADAVIIDRASMSAVSGDWLANQLRQGKLIVGLNIPIVELAQFAGYTTDAGRLERYLQDYGGRPFYSWFYQRTERSGVTRGGTGSEFIYSTEDFLGRLRIKSEGARTDFTLPRSPSQSPLPARP